NTDRAGIAEVDGRRTQVNRASLHRSKGLEQCRGCRCNRIGRFTFRHCRQQERERSFIREFNKRITRLRLRRLIYESVTKVSRSACRSGLALRLRSVAAGWAPQMTEPVSLVVGPLADIAAQRGPRLDPVAGCATSQDLSNPEL